MVAEGAFPGLQMMYPHYDYEYLESIKPKHIPPEKVSDTAMTLYKASCNLSALLGATLTPLNLPCSCTRRQRSGLSMRCAGALTRLQGEADIRSNGLCVPGYTALLRLTVAMVT